MKHYRRKVLPGAGDPALLFEVRLDVQDVRSGFRGTESETLRADWLEDEHLSWTPDMVSAISPGELEEIEPPRLLAWPERGDARMIDFLTRHHRIQIWRNADLGLYSRPRESRQEFEARCRDTLLEARGRELRKTQEIFFHRILELENRILELTRESDWSDEILKSRKTALAQGLFREVREDLNRILLRDDFEPLGLEEFVWTGDVGADHQERLDQLRLELLSRYNEINASYAEKAAQIEPYAVAVRHLQVEIVSRGILWS